MKINPRVFAFIFSIAAFLFSGIANADEINLYDQPTTNAKAVGKVDLSKGIIPIFTSSDGTWMKVGDPRNGFVGWAKASDVKKGSANSSVFTFTQKIMNNGKNANSYQYIELGNAPSLTPEQAEKFQRQQQTFQQAIQKNVQELIKDMHSIFQWQMPKEADMQPIPMPIVVFPIQQQNHTPAVKQAVPATVAPTTSGNKSMN